MIAYFEKNLQLHLHVSLLVKKAAKGLNRVSTILPKQGDFKNLCFTFKKRTQGTLMPIQGFVCT